MKTKKQFHGDAHLREECREAWALHFVKFIQAMTAAGVPIWAVSVQNEPEAAQVWDYSYHEFVVYVDHGDDDDGDDGDGDDGDDDY